MPDLDRSRLGGGVVEHFDDASNLLLDIQWGTGLNITSGEARFVSTAASGWADTGRIQLPYGAEAGQGYGYDYIVAKLYPNEGGGPAGLVWPGNNEWPGFELDMIEAPDREGVFSNHHWRGPNGEDFFNWHYADTLPDGTDLDPTVFHEYGFERTPDRLSYFIDGQMVWTTTENVPVAFEDGGTDLVLGAQITAASRYNQPSDMVRFDVTEIGHLDFIGEPTSSVPDGTLEEPANELSSTAVDDQLTAPIQFAVFPAADTDGGVVIADPVDLTDPVDWDALAALVTAGFEATGVWGIPAGGAVRPDPIPPPPAPGDGAVDWNRLATLETEWFTLTGSWGAPSWFLSGESAPDPVTPDPSEPASPPAVDWNAIAAEVTARFEETGVWS